MLFSSLAFVAFFATFYVIHLALRRHHRAQNWFLLAASYFFYGYWDWRFLALLMATTCIDYGVALAIDRSQTDRLRRRLLVISLVANLGVLGFFKYFDFFADSLIRTLRVFGLSVDPFTLGVILPVGVSFYTFQSMSYTIDVYRRVVNPVRRIDDFALFVAFFPQLMAGPIERSANLVPLIVAPRKLNWAQINAGLFLVAIGFFKKIVVADNVAGVANKVFGDIHSYSGLDLALAALCFTVQIYGDFSGYSDIARGLAKMMGFELMINFKLPYFAISPSDFWRRWHVSLSTWLRDYLYIPLGGNRSGGWRTNRNLLLTMLLGGLWHGAAWNFVFWGLYHGLLLIAYRSIPQRSEGETSRPLYLLRVAVMLFFTIVGWVFFRLGTLDQLGHFFTHVGVGASGETGSFIRRLGFFVAPLLLLELYQQRTRNLLGFLKWPLPGRVALFSLLLLWIALYGAREPMQFIYFQF